MLDKIISMVRLSEMILYPGHLSYMSFNDLTNLEIICRGFPIFVFEPELSVQKTDFGTIWFSDIISFLSCPELQVRAGCVDHSTWQVLRVRSTFNKFCELYWLLLLYLQTASYLHISSIYAPSSHCCQSRLLAKLPMPILQSTRTVFFQSSQLLFNTLWVG